MRQIGCVRCEKFQRDFITITWALIAPFQPVLHRVSCSNELRNAPKHYETYQNMILGDNGVDQVCSLPKITMRVHGTNFELIAPVQSILHRVSCSIETLANALKCNETQTLPNALKCYEKKQNESLGSTLFCRVCSLRKIPRRLRGTNLSINCTGSTYFAPSFV